MVTEFDRYRLPRFRALTGTLQIAAASALLLGLFGFPYIGLLAGLGLSLQMLAGLWVRIRIGDSLLKCLPAFIYMCLNAFIAYRFITL